MIATLPRFSREREILERFINTQSVYAQVDENGRSLLSARLREQIGLGEEALFAGMGDKFQIWTPEDYAAGRGPHRCDEIEDSDPFAVLDRLVREAGS